MLEIIIAYEEGEYDIARQLVNELEDRLGDFPSNVWMEES